MLFRSSTKKPLLTAKTKNMQKKKSEDNNTTNRGVFDPLFLNFLVFL